jgi:hypothetical protein
MNVASRYLLTFKKTHPKKTKTLVMDIIDTDTLLKPLCRFPLEIGLDCQLAQTVMPYILLRFI